MGVSENAHSFKALLDPTQHYMSEGTLYHIMAVVLTTNIHDILTLDQVPCRAFWKLSILLIWFLKQPLCERNSYYPPVSDVEVEDQGG